MYELRVQKHKLEKTEAQYTRLKAWNGKSKAEVEVIKLQVKW